MREAPWSDGLLEAGFGHPAMARTLGWPARVEAMIEVEAALARALGRVGLLDADTVAAVVRACTVASIDVEDLAARAAAAATPVIPLVTALTARAEPAAAAALHHGATSQDIVDTAVALQLRTALDLLDEDLVALADRCAELAGAHRHDVVAGRTLGQQAAPVTFGLKAARWLGLLDRRLDRLRRLGPQLAVVQLGGVVGTLAVYGDRGPDVAAALAEELGLGVPDLPWHAERDRIVDLAGALTGVATAVDTIATDLVLGAQPELGEVREAPAGGPTSSALPHKRNPVHATAARAAARLATGELTTLAGLAGGHEHERAAGAWQAEWVALPSSLVRTGGAVRRLGDALTGLSFDTIRAVANLDAHLGLTGAEALSTALTAHLGRPDAQRVTARVAAAAVEQERPLRQAAADDAEVAAVLDPDALDRVLDPANALRAVDALIDRALATHRAARTAPT